MLILEVQSQHGGFWFFTISENEIDIRQLATYIYNSLYLIQQTVMAIHLNIAVALCTHKQKETDVILSHFNSLWCRAEWNIKTHN